MAEHSPVQAHTRDEISKGIWFVTLSAMAGAFAALALPGPAGSASTIASVLAVGAMALLAGHAWGFIIVAIADVLLLGEVWPMVVFGGDLPTQVTAATALVSTLPGLALLGKALPALVDILFDDDPPRMVRSMGVATCAVLAGLSLLLPAL